MDAYLSRERTARGRSLVFAGLRRYFFGLLYLGLEFELARLEPVHERLVFPDIAVLEPRPYAFEQAAQFFHRGGLVRDAWGLLSILAI